MMKEIRKERVSERVVEQIAVVLFPHVTEDVARLIPQERSHERSWGGDRGQLLVPRIRHGLSERRGADVARLIQLAGLRCGRKRPMFMLPEVSTARTSFAFRSPK